MYSVQNWTLLCNNLYVLGQNTMNLDLNYTLKQFLAIFETFNLSNQLKSQNLHLKLKT